MFDFEMNPQHLARTAVVAPGSPEGIAAAGLADGSSIHQIHHTVVDVLLMFEHTFYCVPISTNISMYYMSYINNKITTINIYIYIICFLIMICFPISWISTCFCEICEIPMEDLVACASQPILWEHAPKIGNTIPVSLRWSNVAIENPP